MLPVALRVAVDFSDLTMTSVRVDDEKMAPELEYLGVAGGGGIGGIRSNSANRLDCRGCAHVSTDGASVRLAA